MGKHKHYRPRPMEVGCNENGPKIRGTEGQIKRIGGWIAGGWLAWEAIKTGVNWVKNKIEQKTIEKKGEEERATLNKKHEDEIARLKEVHANAMALKDKEHEHRMDEMREKYYLEHPEKRPMEGEDGNVPPIPADPHPWKIYKRMGEDVSDREVILTPLQGKWMRKEAHTIIFAPTETGKSTLAGQIAIDIAAGRESLLIPMDHPPKAQRVMYYDLEYDGDDFNGKYQAYLQANPDIKRNLTVRGGVSEYMDLLEQVYDEASKHNDDVVVFIDNLTKLLGGKDVKKFQADATKLVDYLKDKKNIIVTFVILTHTNEVIKYGIREKSDIKDGYDLANTFAPVLIGLGQTHFPENEPEGEVIRVVPVKCKAGVPRNPVIVARKVREPYLHYERICMMHENDTIKADATLPKPSQPDSALPADEEQCEEQLTKYGDTDAVTKCAIWDIIRRDVKERGMKQMAVIENIKEAFQVGVNKGNVSMITSWGEKDKDTLARPILSEDSCEEDVKALIEKYDDVIQ